MAYRRSLVLVITAFFWFAAYTYVPTLGPYARTLGASYDMIGLIIGSYGAVQFLLRVPVGLCSDAWGKRKAFVVAGAALAMASAFGMWAQPSAWALLFYRALSGVAAAAWVAYTVLFASYYPAGDSPKAMGYLTAAGAVGQVCAMFLGGLAAEWHGLTAPFLLGALGGAVAIALSLFVRDEVTTAKPVNTAVLAEITRDRPFLRICGLGVLYQILTFATVFGFSPLAAKALGAGGFELGLLVTVAILPSIAASALSGTLFRRRFGEGGTLALGFAFMGLSSVTIPLCGTLAALYLSQMACGFGRGLIMGLLMGLSIKNFPAEKRATAMGVYQAAYALGMFIGPVLTGVIAGWLDLNTGFLVIGLAGLAGAWLALRPGFLATTSEKTA
ncbi:MAG TPA: MFS transporter [Negativicutes bacterium]|nr:MFS transporter [Negativicutes bacterium]